MSFTSPSTVTGAPNPILPPASPPSHPNSAEMTVDAAIDELASTIEEPPPGQLALFRSVFGIGVSLARYIIDNPLWPLLAAAGLPCSFCVRGKKEANCSVVPHLARCSNCDDKKPCVLGRLAHFRYFSRKCSRDLVFIHRFLEVHGDPGQRTRFILPSEQWRNIAEKIEASTNSTVALIELNVLDEQDQQEVDRLELGEFLRKQPQLPGPSATSSLPLPSPSVVATPRMPAKKRKRSVRQEEGGSSRRKRPIEEVSELDVVPEVHDRKRKCPVGESRDAEVPDHCRVVLVLCTPLVDAPASAALSGGPVDETVRSPPPSEESGSNQVLPPRSQGCSSDLLTRKRTNSPGSSNQFIPPVVPEHRSAVTIKTPPPSQLLEASHTEPSTLTSLLRDTSTSLDDRNKDLEASCRALQDVAADRLEYSRVLPQFRAIKAELPEVPLEDMLTRFHLAVSEVDSYREVAITQKQELSELRKQAHGELDAANARAMRLRDRLEELEESVHRYQTPAHAAEELIWKYPEDEGLYEVDLPSLSSLQDKLTASEAMLRLGGLIELVITLLSHSLLHSPEQMRTVVELALDSLLYYYSNAADRVDGLYRDMFAHSRFSSDKVFLTAAQHAGHVDAHPGSLEPPLHRRLFSFGHPIPFPQSPTSNHIPAVPMMDSVMLMWEDMIEAYIREVLGYPAPLDRVPPPVEAPSSDAPLPATTSLVADDARSVLGASIPAPQRTPLFLLGSLSPTSPCSPSPIPSSPRVLDVPHGVVDLTMDDAEDFYKS
ncbi:hypothetical protein F5876DRAFT_82563 [Lentinula aff. lateritia]|uniref:Uncharacterized protein n=1 Tax=Lentinula aff. lateritia TaxID=2804960 RepID=A0ACC1TJR0_9AGAR|nr:hypothetical protein F5876DRAFT_82563 [Lentinula aff. lateritia]